MITCYHVNYTDGRAEYSTLESAMNRFHEVNAPATLTADVYTNDIRNHCCAGYKLVSSEVILAK